MRRMVTAAVMAASMGFVACGGGGVSRDDYVARGNELCKTGNADMEKLSDDLDKTDDPQEAQRLTVAMADRLEKLLTDLRALEKPEGDEATLTAAYDGAGDLNRVMRQMGDALARLDRAALEDIEKQIDALDDKVNAPFNEYGLTECGKS